MTRADFMRQRAPSPLIRRFASLALLGGVAACSSSENKAATTDSAGGAAAVGAPAAGGAAGVATTPAGTDSGMARMGQGDMAGMAMNRPAPRDSNQAFLRMMSDHHQGLILIADSAKGRVQTADAKAKARDADEKQHREQQQMLTMLRRQYQDSITPMVMPSNRAMLDSVVRAAPAGAVDQVFYRQVIAHHREALQMIDQMESQLKGEVRSMAQRMRSDQQREIQELERKVAKGS